MTQAERQRFNEGLLEGYSRLNKAYGLAEVTTLEEAISLDIETGEQHRVNLSTLDRIIWEEAQTITDGKALFEHLPSSLTPHHRYGMRLNKKYGTGKRAFLAAYMLYIITRLDKESCDWFESICNEQGFDGAFDYLRMLFRELMSCDVKSTDVMGKIENGIGEGSRYHAVDLADEVNLSAVENYKGQEVYDEYARRIRRAGKHQLGAIGKELYAEKSLENYQLTLLWNQYKARKAELQKYSRRRA